LDAFGGLKVCLLYNCPRRQGIDKKELVRLLECAAFQLICKFLYLAFPRHIDDSFGIVEEAVAQKI
jgi:hypothetical protein